MTGVTARAAVTPTPRRRTAALVAVLLGMFMEVLDSSILNVALPTVREDLGATESELQWAVAGYALPFALAMITGGRLGDLYGRRRVFLIGVGAFVVTSVLCGLATSAEMLVVWRMLQGLAAALMLPQTIATIHVMYPPRERSGPLAATGALFAATTVLGPILGAVLTELDIAGSGWRAVFFVNVPIGILTVVAVLLAVPESRSSTAARLDVGGLVLATLALVALLVPVVAGREAGWPPWTIAMLVASPLLISLFVAHQRRRTESPLVELSLFRRRSFTAGLVVMTLAMGAIVGFFFVVTIDLQSGRGFTPLGSALTGIPWGLASAVFAALAMRWLARRLGSRVVGIGLIVTVVGLVYALLVLRATPVGLDGWALTLPLIIGGAGMGCSVVLVFDYALADVPVDDAGSASGVLNTFQQIAGAVGVALVGTLYFALASTGADALAGTLVLPIAMVLVAAVTSLFLPVRLAAREVESAAP
ncbi:DHA2 family efflux MFS transporter permease subunit [Pseudonocardia alaniniphila]|uniref:DHA2 family efflux MFS transporter permease subunit n=1 Tax=Pseudonocardia alaniniphila TaxID=75291 RepID=A0ABS9T9K3_9PSEU|nr:DHA2 family efflux MFS transporter permease subunit [Pseudonocardia alaniniphila]MCH6165098.1 DHA2 family efflux MFS transporter permease subunit [Pseudonocardia alaniniphila]